MATIIRKPKWAECELRIVPEQLPHRFSYKAAEHGKEVNITITKRGVIIGKTLEKSKLPISMVLPIKTFQGVAARAIDDGTARAMVTLELHHHDIDLCIPLLVDTQLYAIASDWRAWSEAYNLPMLMVEADGIARPLDQNMARFNNNNQLNSHVGKWQKPVSRSRRHRSVVSKRRPRFLVRRKMGYCDYKMKISGREIITCY